MSSYNSYLSLTKEFLEWKYDISDIDIRKIDYVFLNDFEFFLRTEKLCNNNTAVKYIINFEKIISICLAHG
ncbi:phage integrase SAM-like domain-containing protein [Chryseobacterium sp. WG23]|uniref:phage integrase SAM-like domain-containing protein n=1 Tax=unclassified Chryseobacterium TaxID=2593645 RepID=UPI00359C95CC